jgi:hypothetical protein
MRKDYKMFFGAAMLQLEGAKIEQPSNQAGNKSGPALVTSLFNFSK